MTWKPGETGNRAGRPPGRPNPTAKLRKALEADLPEIVQAIVEKAKTGDVPAATLLLSRLLPTLKPQSAPEPITDAGDTLTAKASAISESVLAGETSPTAGAELMQMLVAETRILEATEIIERLERLESILKAGENRETD